MVLATWMSVSSGLSVDNVVEMFTFASSSVLGFASLFEALGKSYSILELFCVVKSSAHLDCMLLGSKQGEDGREGLCIGCWVKSETAR